MKWLILFVLINSTATGQTISPFLPKEIEKSRRYLFYLHGGVVTELGNNAINQSMPEWGPYEYLNILDSLQKQGFYVISEVRQKGIENSVYTDKISKQIDSLLQEDVKVSNIVVVGASAGWDIALQVSSKLKNKALHFVMMGGCWPETYQNYLSIVLYGRFLSIIEKTDPHGTCYRIFEERQHIKHYKEIILNTGLSHGFIYKGYPAWIDPVFQWLQER